MKHYHQLAVLLLLVSCSTSKSVVGLYGKCEDGYYACAQIELKADKTFEYFIFFDVGGGTVLKGNWKQVSNRHIQLNTFDQPKIASTVYIGSVDSNLTDSVRIKLSDFETPLAAAYVTINSRIEGKSVDMNGIVTFKADGVESITYHYLDRTETVEIDTDNCNEFEVRVKDFKDLEYGPVPRYLTNEIIRVNKKRLFLGKRYFLRKTGIDDKRW